MARGAPARLLSSRQVARRLGVSDALVRKAIADGRGAASRPSRKQGGRSGWSEDDVALLALTLTAANELRRAAVGLRAHVSRLRGQAGVFLALGPRGARVTRQPDARRLLADLGSPLVLMARGADFAPVVTR